MFEYTLTTEDRVAFNLSLLANGPAARLRRLFWFALFVACLLVFMMPVAVIVTSVRWINPPLGMAVTVGTCALVWLGVMVIWPELPRTALRSWVTRRVTRRLRNKPETAIRLWLDDTGLGVASADGKSHFAWCAISSVGETTQHLFILISKKSGYILPKRVDPAGVAAFATHLRTNAARNREPVPASAAASRPAPPAAVAAMSFPPDTLPTLSFTVTTDDISAALLDFPPRLEAKQRLLRRAGWLRWSIFAINGFLLILLCGLLPGRLAPGWAVLDAVAFVAMYALLRFLRLDHTITRQVAADIGKEVRYALAKGGQRRLWVDQSGLTVADATIVQQFPWRRLSLVETDRHVIVGTGLYSIAIPRDVGQPLVDLVGFVRSCGVC